MINYIFVSYRTLKQQKKFEDYIFERTGRKIKLGPIDYDGKMTILGMHPDLTGIHYTNITCAAKGGPSFDNVEHFIKCHKNWDIDCRVR